MRALHLMAIVATLGGCGGTNDCKPGTLFVSLQLNGASATADQLDIAVQAGGTTRNASVTRTGGGSSGTVEVDFANGYPAGMAVVVSVNARRGGLAVGVGSSSATLSAGCAKLSIVVNDVGGEGFDLAASGDLSNAVGGDLSVTPAPDLATCVWSAGMPAFVDPVNGLDDAMHGAQAGCAYKTIGYALAHATDARINLAFATYGAETYPLRLNGTQSLDCDPAASGNRATLSGGGFVAGTSGNGAAVVFMGTANSLLKCVVTVAPASANGCVNVASVGSGAGGHVVDHCDIHHCNSTAGAGGGGTAVVAVNGGDKLTVTNSTIHDVVNGVMFFGTLTGSVQKNVFTTVGTDAIGCPLNSSPAVLGCLNSYAAPAVCSMCGSCPMTGACP